MLREIVDQVSVGIVVVGPRLDVRLWNGWMEDVSGVDAHRACMHQLSDLMPSLSTSGLEDRIRAALDAGRSSVTQMRGPSRLSWASDVEVRIQPLKANLGAAMFHDDMAAEALCIIQFKPLVASGAAEVVHLGKADKSLTKPVDAPSAIEAPLHNLMQLARQLEAEKSPGVPRRIISGIVDACGQISRRLGLTADEAAKNTGPMRILIAEDNPISRRMLVKMITSRGHMVEEVENGLEALRAVQISPQFDAVLMDIQMPVMDGFSAAMQIRSLLGERGRVPIIALAGVAMRGDRDRFLNAGFCDYVRKPVEPDQLFRKLARVMLRPLCDVKTDDTDLPLRVKRA